MSVIRQLYFYSAIFHHVCSIFVSRMSYCGQRNRGQRSGSAYVSDAITASGPADSVQLLASGPNDFFHIRHWPISKKCISHDWLKVSFVNNHGLKHVQFLKAWLHTYFQEINVNKNPARYNSMQIFTAKSIYMFRVSPHPSSGELKTITAASVTGHNTGTATSLQRGLIGTGLCESCGRYCKN